MQAPHKAVVGPFLGAVVAADVDPSVPSAERAFGGHVVLVGLPQHFARLGIEAGGQPVVLLGQPAALALAGGRRAERGEDAATY